MTLTNLIHNMAGTNVKMIKKRNSVIRIQANLKMIKTFVILRALIETTILTKLKDVMMSKTLVIYRALKEMTILSQRKKIKTKN